MAHESIFIDGAEVVCLVTQSNGAPVNQNLFNDNFTRVICRKCLERKWLIFSQESEELVIMSNKYPDMIYKKSEHTKYFDKYKHDLQEYCKKYFIKFEDQTA